VNATKQKLSVESIRPKSNFVYQLLLLALIYYASAQLGVKIGALKGNIAPLWPPTGIAIAVLLLYGRRFWPGIFLGALVFNGTTGGVPIQAAIGMAVGNTAEAVVAYFLIKRRGSFRNDLSRSQDVLMYFVFGGIIATAISATVGVTSLYANGVINRSDIATSWRTWWAGDALGAIVVGTSLLIILSKSTRRINWKEAFAIELMLVGALLVITEWKDGLAYMVFPFTTLASKRLKLYGAVMCVLTTSAGIIFATSKNIGPFNTDAPIVNLTQVELFIAAVAITSFILAATAQERETALKELRETNLTLDLRVEEQRLQIIQSHALLKEAQQMARLGYWRWEIDPDKVEFSDILLDLTGLSPKAELNFENSLMEIVDEEDKHWVRSYFQRGVSLRENFSIRYRFKNKTGHTRWIQTDAKPEIANGLPVALIGTVRDVTDEQKAEDALLKALVDQREAEKKLNKLERKV
jgi:PAS domain S-box-containing protein